MPQLVLTDTAATNAVDSDKETISVRMKEYVPDKQKNI